MEVGTVLLRAYTWLAARLASARDDQGQGLTEYALIIALIAVAVIAAIVFLGGQISHIFNHVGNCLGNTTASCS